MRVSLFKADVCADLDRADTLRTSRRTRKLGADFLFCVAIVAVLEILRHCAVCLSHARRVSGNTFKTRKRVGIKASRARNRADPEKKSAATCAACRADPQRKELASRASFTASPKKEGQLHEPVSS